MTSTPVNLLLKRSGLASDRPSGIVVQNGELALSAGAADPGLYFEDSVGDIRKIGPSAYAATAPNSSPVGLAGNSVGETWTDSSTADRYFKVWTGSAWEKISAKYADTAGSATTAATATFATSAGSALVASGTIQASGCILASGAIQASGCILASGSIRASGCIVASGAIQASGCILASGAIQASGCVSASGAIQASGAVVVSPVALSLPAPLTVLSGSQYLLPVTSGTYPSGLYVRAFDGYYLV
jgi:hypothetical protein